MAYLVHPDKLAAIEQLIQAQNKARAKKDSLSAAGTPKKATSQSGSPLIDAMAQKLFLERQMKQRGLL